ncbi:MAG: phosphopentomutase [Trueperaceae bacterium]|nr:MAG: phosphopentomutase [Trueperaceae bacterium]
MTVTLLVLDSVGIGSLPDADEFGDSGAHTLDHTLKVTGTELPGFQRLGLGNIEGVTSIASIPAPLAAHGRLHERSSGKDTTTGHWEFMGVVLEHAFRTFQHFPAEVMEAFDRVTGANHLGNVSASGTAIIEELGVSHLESGSPIVYTSADSVFQIAAHVDIVPLETLYRWCEQARTILQGEHAVARVIARPFKGVPGNFTRLGEARRDYSLPPPHKTILDAIKASGKEVIGLGKIPDIYSHQGFTKEVKTGSNRAGIEKTIEEIKKHPDGLVFCNLVEFDSLYGHRRDPSGYAQALLEVDSRLKDLLDVLRGDDVLMLVSDHGNDPTWPGSDHTREYGLLLAFGPSIHPCPIGTRSSFADVGATVAELLHVEWRGEGESFARLLRR